MTDVKTVCMPGMCTGCMACVDRCPKSAIHVVDRLESYDAVIDSEACVGCDACHSLCRQKNDCELVRPIAWQQGWACDEQREKSSSGGAASSIAKAFVRSGGLVWSCAGRPKGYRFFMYEDEESLDEIAGSKYVKSDATGSYTGVRNALKRGRDVLFIGLPCQVSSMRAFVGKELGSRLYTIDLICHGTPSPHILSQFLVDSGNREASFQSLQFRSKGSYAFGVSINGKRLRERGSVDAYTAAFLKGYSYTRACYSCKYASLERVSDLTLGDSWGSNLSEKAREEGISLCLCQTEKGVELLQMADMQLFDVDIERAVESNAQLSAPFSMPEKRSLFFNEIKSGHSISYALFRCMPAYSVKQYVKSLMLRLDLIRIG